MDFLVWQRWLLCTQNEPSPRETPRNMEAHDMHIFKAKFQNRHPTKTWSLFWNIGEERLFYFERDCIRSLASMCICHQIANRLYFEHTYLHLVLTCISGAHIEIRLLSDQAPPCSSWLYHSLLILYILSAEEQTGSSLQHHILSSSVCWVNKHNSG